jgi:DsbC/DsbD-like thiol-disulfide interchange protein
MQGWMAFLPALAASATLAAAQPADEPRAKARLIAEHAALTPGQTNYLGLSFDIEPGWHIYWNGLNDTGMPASITLDLPPGFTEGEIQWPAPKRYISEGDILDHVYEGSVTLLIPIEVPAGATGEVRISGAADWLVCKDVCIMEDAQVSITLPVGGADAGQPSKDARRFSKARESIPTPLPTDNPPIAYHLDGDAYEIRSKVGKYIAFYPAEETAAMKNPIRDAASKTGVLRLALADMSPGSRVRGVIELRPDGGGKPIFHTIELHIADAATPLTAPQSR